MDDFAPNVSEATHPLLRTPESAPLALAAIDSFYVGGERCPFVNAAGDQDEQIVGAMYVQHMVPAERRFPIPVVFIHGGCHTGVTWETTPDGREGWALLFVRGGFETYVIDQAWRGRSAPVLAGGENAPPVTWSAGLSAIPFFTRQGGRFPDVSAEAYAAQFWPDFGILEAMQRGHPGYCDPRALPPLLALLDRIGPAVLVTHSQGGDLGWQAAIHRPAGSPRSMRSSRASLAPVSANPTSPISRCEFCGATTCRTTVSRSSSRMWPRRRNWPVFAATSALTGCRSTASAAMATC